MDSAVIPARKVKKSFCFFFQKEALSYFFMRSSGSFL